MSTNDFNIIADYLRDNPGAIADEIGATPVEMGRLEKAGKVIRVGERKTGKRGRPPVEWALPGQEGYVQDVRATVAQEEAKARVDAYQEYMASSSILWRMRDEMGYVAAKADPSYQAAERTHYERWPMGTVPAIKATDLVLAGLVDPDTEDDES